MAVAIISMAQQASPNMAGHSDERRAQFNTWSTLVTSTFCRTSSSTLVKSCRRSGS